MLMEINQKSLLSPKLTIHNRDAFLWLKELQADPKKPRFDAIVIDVPDPSNFSGRQALFHHFL